MPASKRHVNWTAAVFSQTSPSTATHTFTGVQDIQLADRGSLISHSGDGERMPTVKVSDYQDPMATIRHRDLSLQQSIIIGARGSLAMTHADAKNGTTASGGGYTATLANAILGDKSAGGTHRQFGEATATFEAESSDGTTNPLSYAAL